MFNKKVHLKALDLHIPLRLTQRYVDDGYVADLAEYALHRRLETSKITPEAQRAWLEKYKSDYKNISGITISREFSGFFLDKEEVRIAYLNYGDTMLNCFVRGREETYALKELGQLGKLEEITKATFGLSISHLKLAKIKDIGGVYGLLRKGYTSQEIIRCRRKVGENMKEALRQIAHASLQSGYKNL